MSKQTFPDNPNELKLSTTEGLTVKVYVGNITQLNVDSVVNASNKNLSHGGGVADVISRAAGYHLQDESDDYIRNYGSLKVSECITTSAYNLPYKSIIHAVGPRWYDYPADKKKCGLHLKQTIENCLHEADGNKMETVAIPAISSGIFGVPKEVCVLQYRQAVIDYSAAHGHKTNLKEIHFIDKDSNMIKLIQKDFENNMAKSTNQSSKTTQKDEISKVERGQNQVQGSSHMYVQPINESFYYGKPTVAKGAIQNVPKSNHYERSNADLRFHEEEHKLNTFYVVTQQQKLPKSQESVYKAHEGSVLYQQTRSKGHRDDQRTTKSTTAHSENNSNDHLRSIEAIGIYEMKPKLYLGNVMTTTEEMSSQNQKHLSQELTSKTRKRPPRSERFKNQKQNFTISEKKLSEESLSYTEERPRSDILYDERLNSGAKTIPNLWKSIQFELEVQTPEDIIKSMPKVGIPNEKFQFLIIESLSITRKLKEKFGKEAKIETNNASLKMIYTANRNISLENVKYQAKETLRNLADDVLSLEIPIDGESQLVKQACMNIIEEAKTNWANVLFDNDKLFVVGFRPDCDKLYDALERHGMNVASSYSSDEDLPLVDDWIDIDIKNSEGKPPIIVEDAMTRISGSEENQNLLKTNKGGIQMPPNWDAMDTNETVKQVKLNAETGIGRREFESVKHLFEKSLPQSRIVSITRIQNWFNWEAYYLRKRFMERLYGDGCSNELLLFHGTTHDKLDVIAEHNLDPRLAGERVGALSGKGTYFAVDSQYSDTYAQADDNGHKFMFLVKVLAGKVCAGRPEYTRPPLIDPQNPKSRLFDCCVDNVKSPRTYCLFHDSQYYLEHLIEYI